MKPARIYEPEVDGLRALAVMCVVLYHAGIAGVTGGFVGVDVFFVISGYLITRNILADCAAGTFSFRDFYLHRARRILPAMYFTMAVSAIVAPVILSAGDFIQFVQSLPYAFAAMPNVFFWMKAGYWDTARDFKPLLHFWSLGVEEQFYLVWPALLLLIYRRSTKGLMPIIAILSSLSLLAAEYMLKRDTTAVFYLTPFRVFEFGIGALLVFCIPFAQRLPLWLKEGFIVVGLVGIILPVIKYTEYTAFPGLRALAPCVGAALIIVGRQAKFGGFLFRNRLAVGIGLISYSLYLIHWPLFVFYKYTRMSAFSGGDQAMLIAVSILAAWLMYRFVEQPFRKPAPLRVYAKTACLPLMIFVVLGAGTYGYIHAVSADSGQGASEMAAISRSIEQAEDNRHVFLLKCLIPKKGACQRLHPTKKIMVIGDSYGEDVTIGLFSAWTNYEFWLATDGGCVPVIDYPYDNKDPSVRERCNKRFDTIYKKAFPFADYDAVILSMSWTETSIAQLHETVSYLESHGARRVIVAGPKVTLQMPESLLLPHCDSLSSFSALSGSRMNIQKADHLQALVKAAIKGTSAEFLDVEQAQCPKGQCATVVPGTTTPVIWDAGHWTLEGARFVGERLKAALAL